MSGVILDWSAIRPLNGSRDKGFEELCSQLARREAPGGARFVRKGTPDAGVECYAVLHDGSEWAWQSKYFDALGASQWSQIDKSIKAALEKHPRLIRYFVCIPLDLPDARLDGQKSARDRWEEHVTKWKRWATPAGTSVEFTYWGSHEMLERLARPEHLGLVRFWFDKRGFDGSWFSARLDEAIRTAGPRYTPKVHIELPIAQEFEAFGRTEDFFNRIKKLALRLREKLCAVRYTDSPVTNAEIGEAAAGFSAKVQDVLDGLCSLEAQPTGPLSFQSIATSITCAQVGASEFSSLLEKHESDHEAKPSPVGPSVGASIARQNRSNPFREHRVGVWSLEAELRRALEEVHWADRLTSSALLLLRGVAGIGKTHLLCDVARNRIARNQPTVLLMGQRFVSNDVPWTQALQQLDLAGLTAEEFVGALEAAAQASGARALLMIDAINEGTGRAIWPSHMEAFLAHAERSPWIGVVLSVRSSYEEIVVPAGVLARTTGVTHDGFRGHEYDATRTFFLYYGLELPSTPLLALEFRNPLFLKTLCRGLQAKGEQRLPRGLHGITAVFDLYLSAINERLAAQLGFDRRTPLVRRALEAVSAEFVDGRNRWLALERATAIVDALLPGREFERSLYRNLVVEGILAEDVARRPDQTQQDIVYVAYERFADHLVAKALLDRHLDAGDFAAAFGACGKLSFVGRLEEEVAPGLLEALCIQVAERCGQELVTLVPTVDQRWGIEEAFRQSLVWRAVTAFTEGTRKALSDLCRSDDDLHSTLDVLLTVAMLPGHPFNARFLDKRLRKDPMAERDSWWSIYLHGAWRSLGAVDRLVDWASAVTPETLLDEDTAELAATTLAWMLTTSNRFLRDRATKALVAVLTGRLGVATLLVEQFSDVDDPYVGERVYAVAYGVAMRSHDPREVGSLAVAVYERVFATGNPFPHLLLRDYARGVVERALHLGSQIGVDAARIRPPYKSQWPTIPSEEDIKPFLADRSKGSYVDGDLEWSRNRISGSVLADDFGLYVIGTNSSRMSSDWLSLTLDEALWVAPLRPKDMRLSLEKDLSDEERPAWQEWEAARTAYESASRAWDLDRTSKLLRTLAEKESLNVDAPRSEMEEDGEEALSPELKCLGERQRTALAALETALTEKHVQQLRSILDQKETGPEESRPPRFDLGEIQRYIVRRVFELGWTVDRFGRFDRFSIGIRDREAHKAERIGKKYQWIAYYEILALVSDHFQYREQHREADGDKAYEGPWQDSLRDIDPSCAMRASRGGTSWEGHTAAWWARVAFNDWGRAGSERNWVLRTDDLPKVEGLLLATNPQDGSHWLNAQGYFSWKQQAPAGRESTDVDRGELWHLCTGYLIRKDDAEAFLKWAEGVDFWGRWMPDPATIYQAFLGEHPWAPASSYFERQYFGDDGWTQPSNGCPVKIRTAALEYRREDGGFDCSVDEGYALRLPVRELVSGLGVRWAASGADFVDPEGRLAAQDPTAHCEGPSALLLRNDLLQESLSREKLSLCWAVLGEKRILAADPGTPNHPTLRMSGAYVLGETGLMGFVKRILDGHGGTPKSPELLNTYRLDLPAGRSGFRPP